jgi:hypothetical protein
VTVLPVATVTRPLGAFGALVHAVEPTVRIDSFEGALWPYALTARTLTKYVPGPTPGATYNVAVLPVFEFARLLRPAAEPACRT